MTTFGASVKVLHGGRQRLGVPELQVERGEGSARIVELNHVFGRLCGPPSIPLSFTVAGVRPRWDA